MLNAFLQQPRNKRMAGMDAFALDIVQNILVTLMEAGLIEKPVPHDTVHAMVQTVEYLLETAGRA
jgi:hypothetical protein